MIILIITINIVAGIIIDTFASLRETEKEKNSDIQEICFICGNRKETFEKKSEKGGFLKHIKL